MRTRTDCCASTPERHRSQPAQRRGDRGRAVTLNCQPRKTLDWKTPAEALDQLRRPLESAQYLSIKYTERLAEAGIEQPVGSIGDVTTMPSRKPSMASTRPRLSIGGDLGSRRVHNARMGGPVQQLPAAGAYRQHPAG
jgi:hypothetical protein